MSVPGTSRIDLGWRSYTIIILFGCLVAMIGFGPRSSLGLFMPSMTAANNWSRDIFAFAIALQMLLWGAAQPVAGAFADRYGAPRVVCISALLYAGGLAMMAYSTSAGALFFSAGVLIGFGLSGIGFTIVIGAFGKLLPVEWRTFSFGIATAASSFGQFLFSPLAAGLNSALHWQTTLLIFAAIVLLTMPLSLALAKPREAANGAGQAESQSVQQAVREALSTRSYILLVTGYFTCGFQLFFITVHLPAYLVDRGISVEIGAWTLAIIGLFNIIGSLGSGFLATRLPKRYMLAVIYALRSLAILVFINLPASPWIAMSFGAVIGLLWLSSVPPTQGIIAVLFGTRWLTMLAGLAFFNHQLGGFLGVWLGGLLYESSGSYTAIWYVTIALGIISAVVSIPIIEKPVARPVAASA